MATPSLPASWEPWEPVPYLQPHPHPQVWLGPLLPLQSPFLPACGGEGAYGEGDSLG